MTPRVTSTRIPPAPPEGHLDPPCTGSTTNLRDWNFPTPQAAVRQPLSISGVLCSNYVCFEHLIGVVKSKKMVQTNQSLLTSLLSLILLFLVPMWPSAFHTWDENLGRNDQRRGE